MPRTKRHHFLPQFYLRNFTEANDSPHVNVYRFEEREWNKQPITPKGIGWSKDLYAINAREGEVSDFVERSILGKLDDETAPSLTKLRTLAGLRKIDSKDRVQVARFVSFLFSRNPKVLAGMIKAYSKEPREIRAHMTPEDKAYARRFRENKNDKVARLHFNKFCLLDIEARAEARAKELLTYRCKFVRTGPDRPFVTSDYPVFGEHEKGIEFFSCPLSSEVGVIYTNGKFQTATKYGGLENVKAMNWQTFNRAEQFIVCRNKKFAGFEEMTTWLKDRRKS